MSPDSSEPSPRQRCKPELMSPAGHWPELTTAIEAGADAVYFGLNHFSARAKVGFAIDELDEVIAALHYRQVKGFVTFNTLVFDHELQQAELAIEKIADAGADAIIVQDIGVARLVQEIAPELEIHGSTQMSITSAQGAEFAAGLGCSRVVLGRELSLADIGRVAAGTSVELEVFVHGALCVSYSGQCFSSEAWGGRSANRGKCAQACRLSYDLIVDGQLRDLGAFRYLLSPGDLCALDQIPALIDLGISCVKIEGRYKDAGYVGLTTRIYREAIDQAWSHHSINLDAQQRTDLEQIYSRGLGDYFIGGTDHQRVVLGRAPRHRGLRVGTVIKVGRRDVLVAADETIRPGDGLVFDAADWRSPDEPEEGGHVYVADTEHPALVSDQSADQSMVRLEFGHGEIDFTRIRAGDVVWRTNDPQLNKRLKKLTQSEKPVYTRPLDFVVEADVGQPLKIVASNESGIAAEFEGDEPLQPANKRALDRTSAVEKLGRLGGTPYHLGTLELISSSAVFVPSSLLNQIRRELVDAIGQELYRTDPTECKPMLADGVESLLSKIQPFPSNSADDSGGHLHVLVRTGEQLDGALEAAKQFPLASITLDYLELYGLRPAVERVQQQGIRARVASPRMLKPAEQNVVRFLHSLQCDVLVRSSGLLVDLQQLKRSPEIQWVGDFSLNAANAISGRYYLSQGLQRITPTYDLNAQQIEDLTHQIPAGLLEVIGYSHLPVFHTEHCVFCRFLSDGTDHTNCGHPCEQHRIAVRDGQGRPHPVMADVGCRNTVFGAEAQTDPVALRRWREAGVSNFRIELVHQSQSQTEGLIAAFAGFLGGTIDQGELYRQLESNTEHGSTEGSLFVPPGFKQLVQLQG